MRTSLIALLSVAMLAACSQAPVNPAAPVQTQAPAGATMAAADCPPPPAQPVRYLPPPPPTPVQRVPVDENHRLVKIETNMGDILVQLNAERAPLTVKNFLAYVKDRYYDNSGFYRVVPGFVIQGGDFTPELKYHQPKRAPIPNESGNGLSNQPGAIGMGTDAYPHSAQAAFYIDLEDNRKLDPRPDRWGYAVFGQVVEGMDVVRKIATVETHTVVPKGNKPDDAFHDVPVQPVKILKVTLEPLPGAVRQ
ncbi:MAG TPA: peptidylprolyl isomerase [Gammaproteobacteria bacterium]